MSPAELRMNTCGTHLRKYVVVSEVAGYAYYKLVEIGIEMEISQPLRKKTHL